MVITFNAHRADTPAGSPIAEPMPVAPVVVCVIFVNAELMQSVGAEEATLTLFAGVTVIVPVALISAQAPLIEIV